jgi:hypothetical protein
VCNAFFGFLQPGADIRDFYVMEEEGRQVMLVEPAFSPEETNELAGFDSGRASEAVDAALRNANAARNDAHEAKATVANRYDFALTRGSSMGLDDEVAPRILDAIRIWPCLIRMASLISSSTTPAIYAQRCSIVRGFQVIAFQEPGIA